MCFFFKYIHVHVLYLTCILCATDEIEFEVGTDSRTNKLIARRLVRLPAGTVSFESISEERLLGKVDCEPRVVSTPTGSGDGAKGNRVSWMNPTCIHLWYMYLQWLCRRHMELDK